MKSTHRLMLIGNLALALILAAIFMLTSARSSAMANSHTSLPDLVAAPMGQAESTSTPVGTSSGGEGVVPDTSALPTATPPPVNEVLPLTGPADNSASGAASGSGQAPETGAVPAAPELIPQTGRQDLSLYVAVIAMGLLLLATGFWLRRRRARRTQ